MPFYAKDFLQLYQIREIRAESERIAPLFALSEVIRFRNPLGRPGHSTRTLCRRHRSALRFLYCITDLRLCQELFSLCRKWYFFGNRFPRHGSQHRTLCPRHRIGLFDFLHCTIASGFCQALFLLLSKVVLDASGNDKFTPYGSIPFFRSLVQGSVLRFPCPDFHGIC